ncbi:MAG: hypothetical protein ACXWG8_00750 [Usitatibacter sp.]
MAGSSISGGTRVMRGAAFALALAFAGAVQGAQVGSQFDVKVMLKTQFKEPPPEPPTTGSGTGLCRIRNMPGAFGAMVTVVCATGVVVEIWPPESRPSWVPTHGGSYRFLPPVSLAGVMSDNLDMNTGLGTVTSWRVIKMADHDFLEMTVRW